MNGRRAASAAINRLISLSHCTEMFEGVCVGELCAIKDKGGKKLPGLKLKHITSDFWMFAAWTSFGRKLSARCDQ